MKKSKLITILAIFCLIFWQGLKVNPANAFEFDPNDIITDNELYDYDAMDLAAIQEFLENQTGVLNTYYANDSHGNSLLAAEIIANAGLEYKVNPKWILATLQKEQSLVTNPLPSQRDFDWAMGYAVCDSCSKDDPQIAMFKGFGMQIDRATWRIQYYYENPEKFNFRVGQIYSIDGRDVMMFNQATANLFNYTPHLHGNYNFWTIWNRWFAKIYPDGTLLKQAGDIGIWIIDKGQRRPFWSKTALISRYDESKVIEVSKNDLQRYTIGYPIKYPNYSLLQSPAGQIYLIVNNEKKEIESEEVFKSIGYNPEEVIPVTDDELAHYEDGRKITLESIYPQGALLQDNKTGGVYYVEDGIKYPVLSKEILKINYAKYKLTKVSPDELAKYVTAANGVKLKDGTLIGMANDPKIYVISNGQRRWIANESTFNQLGYEWTNIVTVSEKVLTLHPEGDKLDSLVQTDAKMATN
ncbi:MAG: hypothetical protein NTX82_06750 [Candidatus Parcubacteria bacterium]|nr:hypothetical protein [Candidatus Parcubacteria bacterium]